MELHYLNEGFDVLLICLKYSYVCSWGVSMSRDELCERVQQVHCTRLEKKMKKKMTASVSHPELG